MSFKEIQLDDLSFNPFNKISKEWFLVTSGNENRYNTMTASWGFVGVMWRKNCFTAVVRPNRYTYEFIESNSLFTVCFFNENRREDLKFCGANSGRNCNKAKETGLTPMFIDGTTAFEQAELILVCRKIYAADMDNSKLLPELQNLNEKEPIHKQYIGEILKVYQKQGGPA